MLRLFVRGGRLRRAVSFHQHKACRVVLLLVALEAGDARLLLMALLGSGLSGETLKEAFNELAA